MIINMRLGTLTPDELKARFLEFNAHYSSVRLFVYENFDFSEDNFTYFTNTASKALEEILRWSYTHMEISSYSKEKRTCMYLSNDSVKVDIEFYNS